MNAINWFDNPFVHWTRLVTNGSRHGVNGSRLAVTLLAVNGFWHGVITRSRLALTRSRLAVTLLVVVIGLPVMAQPILVHPDGSATLDQRWSWGMTQSRTQKGDSPYWIGYSIRRLMGPYDNMGTWSSEWEGLPSLEDRIAGKRSVTPRQSEEEEIREAARRVLKKEDREHEKDAPKVWRKVAILVRFQRGASELECIAMQTMSSYYDLKGYPLFWLGASENGPSLDLLTRLYDRLKVSANKNEALGAIAVHQEPGRVIPCLERILTGKEEDNIRKQAAFWMGEQDTPEALRILNRTARGDRSVEVRKQAVFGISQVHLPEATDALIDLARNADTREVKKQALFWLAQRASRNVAETIKGFVYDDSDTEIKKQAVFALTQLRDGEGVPMLIEIAKTHPQPEVRKQAIFWLGQSNDPRAVETLIDIARQTR